MHQISNCVKAISFCVLLLLSVSNLEAQDSSHTAVNQRFSSSHVFAGTQIPLQFTAGYEYSFSSRISARAQLGFITKPYSGFIPNVMEALGMDKYLAKVIKKAFNSGTVIGIGPNYNFGKNYIGVYGHYMLLKGEGITVADALSVYFKRDFTETNLIGLPVFEFSVRSDLVNVGALFGHQFLLRNSKFSIDTEVGLSKVVASKNSFASNLTLVDQTSFAQNLYKQIDHEIQDAYWKYGFIPTFNVYLV